MTELIELTAELKSGGTNESRSSKVKLRLIYLSIIQLMNSSSRPNKFCSSYGVLKSIADNCRSGC